MFAWPAARFGLTDPLVWSMEKHGPPNTVTIPHNFPALCTALFTELVYSVHMRARNSRNSS